MRSAFGLIRLSFACISIFEPVSQGILEDMTVQATTSRQIGSITLMGVSSDSYDLLKRDLRNQPIQLTYDSGWLQIDRQGGEVGVLEPVEWETYESLCRDFSDHGPRM